MDKHRVTISDLMPIDVWVTPNIKIFRQVGFWEPRYKTYQFIPAKPKGFVILTRAHEKMHCRPLQGYVLYRPTAIELAWLSDKTLNFRELSMIDAMTWNAKNQGKWKTIGNPVPRTGNWGDIRF